MAQQQNTVVTQLMSTDSPGKSKKVVPVAQQGYMGYAYPKAKVVLEKINKDTIIAGNEKKVLKQQEDNLWLCNAALKIYKKLHATTHDNPLLYIQIIYLKAEILREQKTPEYSLPIYEEALELLKKFPTSHVGHYNFALLYHSLGELHRVENNLDMALNFYFKALSIFKVLYKIPLAKDYIGTGARVYVNKNTANNVDSNQSVTSLSSSVNSGVLSSPAQMNLSSQFPLQTDQQNLIATSVQIMNDNTITLHPFIADVESNIAMLYYSQGKYSDSKAYFESSMRMRVQLYYGNNKNHPMISSSVNNYAGLLFSLGHYAKALPLYEKSLQMKLVIYGNDVKKPHSEIASSYNNIGLLMKALGKFEKAKYYYDKALAIQVALYGEKHPYVASTMNNKAALLVSLNQFIEAKELYERVLQLKQSIYGQQDPMIASSMNNLAGLLFQMGDVIQAKKYYEESLKIRKLHYGEKHITVAESYHNIGLILFSQSLYEQALDYYEQALKIKIELYGENHATVASSMHNLAGLLHKMNRIEEATQWYRKSYTIRRNVLGDGHPDTNTSYENLRNIENDRQSGGDFNLSSTSLPSVTSPLPAAGNTMLFRDRKVTMSSTVPLPKKL